MTVDKLQTELPQKYYEFIFDESDGDSESTPCGEFEINEADFFPDFQVQNGFGTKCFDHPSLPFRRLERHIRREISLFGGSTPFPGASTPLPGWSTPRPPSSNSPPGSTPLYDSGIQIDNSDGSVHVVNKEFEELRNKLNEEMRACDDMLCQEYEVENWKKFFQIIDDSNTIQEIYVESKESRPIIKDGPRQRYQRFREKAFVCDVCDHWFTLKQNVQMHIFNYHMGPNTVKPRRGKRYKCTKCEQMFKSLSQAQKHERRMHKEKIRQMFFRCEECGKVYQTASQLREHVSIMHLNERPFKCEQCDAAFGRRGGLRRHIVMVHTGHTYKCPIDGCEHPGYKCSKALAAHIRSVHTKDRPFVCLMCEKSFVRKNDLKMHEFTHGNGASFECELCGESFKRAVYRKKHQVHCMQKLERAKELGIDPKELRKFENAQKKQTDCTPSPSKSSRKDRSRHSSSPQPGPSRSKSSKKKGQGEDKVVKKERKSAKRSNKKVGSKLEESVKKIKKLKREQKKREKEERSTTKSTLKKEEKRKDGLENVNKIHLDEDDFEKGEDESIVVNKEQVDSREEKVVVKEEDVVIEGQVELEVENEVKEVEDGELISDGEYSSKNQPADGYSPKKRRIKEEVDYDEDYKRRRNDYEDAGERSGERKSVRQYREDRDRNERHKESHHKPEHRDKRREDREKAKRYERLERNVRHLLY
ncbi:unnamed protein product [Bursaphelenchus xylophilus]|uniref:(pine wood nematode) hypothetical protein n=1 Tax=Bursaphelenchus xylophilus TaxID=6326 RepID=A0A1I7S969_BURXY|nr:unnamed protein product [Bursaphelenchus xylophilus]CAG9100403.1 unnamed protein product [Bursaphelenchus xylophilus]